MTIKIILSLLPVFLFLLALVLLDSYKLIKPAAIIAAIIAGWAAAGVCYFININFFILHQLTSKSK